MKQADELKQKLNKLTENQYKFFVNVTDPTSDTTGNITTSYLKAGYKPSKLACYRASMLYKSKRIQDIITLNRLIGNENSENRKETAFERVVRRNEQLYLKAEKTGDISAMKALNEFDAKLHGLLVDRHQVIDPTGQDDLDNSVKIEAAKLAERMLLNAPECTLEGDIDDPSDNIIDGDFEPLSDDMDVLSDDMIIDHESFLTD